MPGVRIAIDGMGGDRAPGVVIKGTLKAAQDHPDAEIHLFGDEKKINDEIPEKCPDNVVIHHCSQMVGMNESPVSALKKKQDSSIVRSVLSVREGLADVVMSMGNTGACVAAATLYFKKLPGIQRPGILSMHPSKNPPGLMMDVGANINCRPIHLVHYAIMMSAYAREIVGRENPSVGLLNIGEEAEKGTDFIKNCYELLSSCSSLNFAGNVEGSDLWSGKVDAVVMDGFVGNIVLKLMEGQAEALIELLVDAAEDENDRSVIQNTLGRLNSRLDYSEYGAAPLLGLEHIVLIGHGKSNARAFENGIKQAIEMHNKQLNRSISETISGLALEADSGTQ